MSNGQVSPKNDDDRLRDLESKLKDLESKTRFWFPTFAGVTVLSLTIAAASLTPKLLSWISLVQEFQAAAENVHKLDSHVDQVDKHIAELDARVQEYRNQISELSTKAQWSVLSAQVRVYKQTLQDEPRPITGAWDKYRDGLERLNDFAVQYVAFLRSSHQDPASSTVFSAIREAAEQLRPIAVAIGDGNDHVSAITNFENLLQMAKNHNSQGNVTTGEVTMCYESAFPVWTGQTGVYLPDLPQQVRSKYAGGNQTSPRCKDVLGFRD